MPTPSRLLLILLLAALAPIALAQRGGRHAVSMKEMKFDPAALEIKVGDSVVWTNNDDRDHTVATEKGPLKSDNLKPGKTYTFQFTSAGKIDYTCSLHPRMKGTITVKE